MTRNVVFGSGHEGDDRWTVTSAADVVTELANEGTDTVYSAIDYALGPNVENLALTGAALTATGNALDIVLVGNALDNLLTGLDGDDRLDGRAGADLMVGGAGNDRYFVNNAGDRIVEAAGDGTDRIFASVDYVMPDNVETLTLTGTATSATGGSSADTLIGNDLANMLLGNDGNDRLDGRAGADTMTGGAGDDTYFVDDAGDLVGEASGGGLDRVYAQIDYALPANIERLNLLGTAESSTGNQLNNVVVGNALNNVIAGLDADSAGYARCSPGRTVRLGSDRR